MKPFNSITIYSGVTDPPDDEIKKERFRPQERISKLKSALDKQINTTSQLHLDAVAEGGIRCICNSLYPLERTFTRHKGIAAVIRYLTKNGLNISEAIFGPVFLKLLSTLTGYEIEIIRKLDEGDLNYFEHLRGEYDYMVAMQNQVGAGWQYQIAKNYQDVVSINTSGKLAVIHTIEGINAFLERSGDFDAFLEKEKRGDITEVKETFSRNILDFKNLDFPPFILTLAHQQYNFICGHSESYIGLIRNILKQDGHSTLENSTKKISFYDIGIRSWGYEIIDLILSRNSGACGRMLIDTKHMSVRARQDYHAYVKRKNQDGDQIPIVQTHTCVNGRSWNANPKKWKKNLDLPASAARKICFNTAAINTFDEEIMDIIASDGLIGIMLDEKRLVGHKLPEDTANLIIDLDLPYSQQDNKYAPDGGAIGLALNMTPPFRLKHNKDLFASAMQRYIKAKRKLEEAIESGNATPGEILILQKDVEIKSTSVAKKRGMLLPIEMSLIINQFLHILKVSYSKYKTKAWKHICIGSDYEGVINPLDIFYYASDLNGLKTSMVQYWHFALDKSRFDPEFEKYADYLGNYTPEFIVQQILWDNAADFMKKYFHDGYRKDGVVGQVA